MDDLFFSKKAIACRLLFLVLALMIVAIVVSVFDIHSPWSALFGAAMGSLSQMAARKYLEWDAEDEDA